MTNNKKCLANECENPAFKEMDRCALHCEKGDYSKDFNSMLLHDFYDLFVQYIYDYLNSSVFGDKFNFSLEEFEEFCNKDDFSNEKIINDLNDKVFVPTNIVFPAHKDIDFFDYTKLLRLFKSIHFNYCEFSCTSLELDDVGVFFKIVSFTAVGLFLTIKF